MAKVGVRSLLPYLRDHRTSLLLVGTLSLITTLGTLAQPLLTRRIRSWCSSTAGSPRWAATLS